MYFNLVYYELNSLNIITFQNMLFSLKIPLKVVGNNVILISFPLKGLTKHKSKVCTI